MNQAKRAARKIPPAARIAAAAGLTVGVAGVWAWRRKTPTALPARIDLAKSDETRTTTTAAPTPPPLQRTGPMVAVYLDGTSVEKLQRQYPNTKPGRLRKVVIQYDPSEEQRDSYDKHFGALATVKLTGEASSENRLALMASVSSDMGAVDPQSLSCAVDVTPGDKGGGPLASTVLIEQIKRAGAITEESWEGLLPAISAHERDFPIEEGNYHKLETPLILKGSICRADWVEGTTGLCRTTTAGGSKRQDGWKPQGCSICNTLGSSPCRDIFIRFDSLSKRINELQPEGNNPQANPVEATSEGASASKDGAEAPSEGASASRDDERNVEKARERGGQGRQAGGSEIPARRNAAGKAAAGDDEGIRPEEGAKSPKSNGEQGEISAGTEEDGEFLRKATETEEERRRREEVDMLEEERHSVMMEMLTCSQYHHVFEDSNADDGIVPEMPDDEAADGDGDGEANSSEGSEAEKDSAVEKEEDTTEQDAQQPSADDGAHK